MKFTIYLSDNPVPIKVEAEDGGGSITSNLKVPIEDEDEGDENLEYNAAIDGIESLILAHACAGVDVQDHAYIEGIETAVEACANNL